MSDLQNNYAELLKQIAGTLKKGQVKAVKFSRRQMVLTYWAIGQHIVEYEQKGKEKSVYGSKLLNRLSKDLSDQLGKGFSRTNLISMRLCYLKYGDVNKVSDQLTWGHLVELVNIDHDLERSFYEKQTISAKWNVRELKRQKKSALFLRLAASKDKKGILDLAKKGQIIEKAEDIIRDTYVFEFLKIPEPYRLNESELESRLIEHLAQFLLELGKGFAFIGRQYRITLANRHHYVDLVFYHRILKCFVLLDLKIAKAGYQDVGQMNMYLGYFENEENTEGDNPPIGIVLAKEKDELLIQYAMHGISSQLFVSKYQLYLPNEEELRKEIEAIYLEEE